MIWNFPASHGITTFKSGGHTYAAAAAYGDNGVQILNVTNPYDVTAAGSITDDDDLELEGTRYIATFKSGGHTYAAVTAVMVTTASRYSTLQTHTTLSPQAASKTTMIWSLEDARGIATFESGGRTYAAVTAYGDNGVQILDITNPYNITPAGSIKDDDDLDLNSPSYITTFESGGHVYAGSHSVFRQQCTDHTAWYIIPVII